MMRLFYLLVCALLSFGCAERMLHRVLRKDGMRTRRDSDSLSITELVVTSNVSLRFANVTIWSQLRNSGSNDEQAAFDIRIPKSAFITSFVLYIGNKTIKAEVKEKAKAHNEYEKALTDDITAGHVTQQTAVTDDFDRDVFHVAVNVAARSSVAVSLQYQELLERSAGKFFQKLYFNPGEMVEKLEVNCEYRELQRFKLFRYRTPFDNVLHPADEDQTLDDGFYRKSFKWVPSERVQEVLMPSEKPLEIEYDLTPVEDGGQLVYNRKGDFAHFFSPPCQEDDILAKQIVFVIDRSGSMKGIPITQVRTAMETILNQLRPRDFFNIVLFYVTATKWRPYLMIATPSNIDKAQEFLKNNLRANGGTNINTALLTALDMFGAAVDGNVRSNVFGHIVVFLTDGEASHGIVNRDDIRQNVRNVNHFTDNECCKTVVHTIAFGKKSDVHFLRMLSFENGGVLYTIKENSEASVDNDLLNFYDNMKNPYLRNVSFSFSSEGRRLESPNVTQSEFIQFDCGSEIVVGGNTRPGVRTNPRITAEGSAGKVEYDSVPSHLADGMNADLLSRLVVYKKVRDILKEAEVALDETDKQKALDLALNISLQYQFVTPYTSLIVTVHKAAAEKFTPVLDGRMQHPATRDVRRDSFRSSGGTDLYDLDTLFLPDSVVPDPVSEENGARRAAEGNLMLAVIAAIMQSIGLQ